MNATCPECGATFPTDPGTTQVYAELRRFDRKLFVDAEFECGACHADIVVEQLGDGTLIHEPNQRAVRFNGEGYTA